MAAFRRLAPEDLGYFLATIEADLGGTPLELDVGSAPRLLPGSADTPVAGSLREAVLSLLADGRPRSTMQIRQELEATRQVNRASLNTEIFTLRKMGLVHSEGQGRGRRHTRAAKAAASVPATSAGKAREIKPRTRKKRDDEDDHPARTRGAGPDAEKIYAAAIGDHHLLTADEEWELAQRLEDVEIAIWQRLLDGSLGGAARELLSVQDPPVIPADAKQARAADLDRLIANRVIADAANHAPDEVALLRPLVAEADRIRERFISCNLRMVPATIRRHGYHLTTSLSMSDLIQEGNFGLIKAVSRFDHRRGLRFSTFATWWIRHYLVRARQNLGAEVRVPVHLHDLASKAQRARTALRQKLGREPDQSELARTLNVSRRSLQTLESAWLKHRESLPAFDSVGEDGSTPSYLASDEVPASEILSRQQEDGRLAAAVARIPAPLAQIVRRRFGLDGDEPETLIQIGDSMQLSRERIRQLEKKALTVLRQALAEMDLAA